MMQTMYKQNKGFSLIELMIATLIGILLLLGAVGMFISNKRIYKEQDATGRMQENARFAMQMLIKDIRRAGFTGCAHDISTITNNVSTDAKQLPSYTADNIIEGAESSGGWLPSGSTDTDGISASDAITIRSIQPVRANVISSYADEIEIDNTTADIDDLGLAGGNTIAIFDCAKADITYLQPRSHQGRGWLFHEGLTNDYDANAEVAQFRAVRYYIADTNDADGDGTGDPALWRSVWKNNEIINEELVEGVENMQILYGVDSNADQIPDSYVRANQVAKAGGWDKVNAIKLALLFRTIHENRSIDPDTRTYTLLNSAAIGPYNDHRRRKIFGATVKIMNRSL